MSKLKRPTENYRNQMRRIVCRGGADHEAILGGTPGVGSDWVKF
jgi:hypothetical protein